MALRIAAVPLDTPRSASASRRNGTTAIRIESVAPRSSHGRRSENRCVARSPVARTIRPMTSAPTTSLVSTTTSGDVALVAIPTQRKVEPHMAVTVR